MTALQESARPDQQSSEPGPAPARPFPIRRNPVVGAIATGLVSM